MGSKGHIMLSYQWDYQSEVKKIFDALKRFGFKVWMDLEAMSGDIYQKMAEGVEGANIIIVCMSSKYQTSENCQKEFEYAQVNRKTIIPIKMEKGFNPTGALGLITAGKLYINFSNMSNFNENIASLKKEIESHLGKASATSSQAASNTSSKQSSGSWEQAMDLEAIDHFLVDDSNYNRAGCLAIKSSRKRWIFADSDNRTVQANRPSLGPWEKFSIASIGSGIFSIKAWTGKYVSAKSNGKVEADADRISPSEKWVIFTRNDAIALKSGNGKWLSASPSGELTANKDKIGNYEQFYPYQNGDELWRG